MQQQENTEETPGTFSKANMTNAFPKLDSAKEIVEAAKKILKKENTTHLHNVDIYVYMYGGYHIVHFKKYRKTNGEVIWNFQSIT